MALELSHFLASSHTLLVGNFSRVNTAITNGPRTNASSLRKNQKLSLWRIFAVSGGYLAKLTWACTALYHLSTLLLPCQKLVKRSNHACTSFDYGLQKSSNLAQIISNVSWSIGKPQETYWSIPKSLDKVITFCIVAFLVMLQVHIPVYFCTWDATLEIYGTVHHWLSSPFWDPLYMAWMYPAVLVAVYMG